AMSEEAASNKALVRDSFEAWANGTGGPFQLLADDAVWTIEGNSLAPKPMSAATLLSTRLGRQGREGVCLVRQPRLQRSVVARRPGIDLEKHLGRHAEQDLPYLLEMSGA